MRLIKIFKPLKAIKVQHVLGCLKVKQSFYPNENPNGLSIFELTIKYKTKIYLIRIGGLIVKGSTEYIFADHSTLLIRYSSSLPEREISLFSIEPFLVIVENHIYIRNKECNPKLIKLVLESINSIALKGVHFKLDESINSNSRNQ